MSSSYFSFPFFRSAPTLLVAIFLMGCVGLGERVQRAELPDNAPTREEILRDLGSNDQAIRTFRAAGEFTVESPQLTAVQRFPIGHAKFRKPGDLYVQGQKRLGPVAFKLTCVGDAYLMEVPAKHEESFYQLEGDTYRDVPFSVSPSDIAREMFLPEPWLELPRAEARLIGFDEAAQSALLEIGPEDAPRRRIDVARVNLEHPAWVVTRNARLDGDGNVIAVTELSHYHEIGGIRFPALIDAYFPTEETRMTFELRNIRPNYALSDADFDIERRIRELNLKPRQTS